MRGRSVTHRLVFFALVLGRKVGEGRIYETVHDAGTGTGDGESGQGEHSVAIRKKGSLPNKVHILYRVGRS